MSHAGGLLSFLLGDDKTRDNRVKWFCSGWWSLVMKILPTVIGQKFPTDSWPQMIIIQ